MKSEEAQRYVCENLGIDIAAGKYCLDLKKVSNIIEEFPYKGVLLSTGREHLLKAGSLCYSLLKADKITGSIERFESWEVVEIGFSCGLIVLTNLSEDLMKPQAVISAVYTCMKLNTPMIFTTPLEIEDLENSLPMSVLSNIFPYLYGKI